MKLKSFAELAGVKSLPQKKAAPDPTTLLDILYLGDGMGAFERYDEIQQALKTHFPHIILKDASDGIHGYRWEVELPYADYTKYITFLHARKCLGLSFRVQMDMHLRPDRLSAVLKPLMNLTKKKS